MQGKIVTKIGLMVLVGWLAVACKNCQQEGPDTEEEVQASLVEVKYHVKGTALYLIGGASGEEATAIPDQDNPAAGWYKAPITLEVAPGKNETIPIKLLTNRKYFVYKDRASAQEDANAKDQDGKILDFLLNKPCVLVLDSQEVRGIIVPKGEIKYPVRLEKDTNANLLDSKFVLKQVYDADGRASIVAVLEAGDPGPVEGDAVVRYVGDGYWLHLIQEGLMQDGKPAPPFDIGGYNPSIENIILTIGETMPKNRVSTYTSNYIPTQVFTVMAKGVSGSGANFKKVQVNFSQEDGG